MFPRLNRKKTMIPAVLLAGLMLGTSVYAVAEDGGPGAPHGEFAHDGPDGHHRHGGFGGPFMHELKSLDLSDSQRETIRGYVKASHEDRRAAFESMHTAHRAFETAVPGSAGYGTVVAQMADAAGTAAREQVQKQAALRAQIYAVLTDAQKSRLASTLASLPERPLPPPR